MVKALNTTITTSSNDKESATLTRRAAELIGVALKNSNYSMNRASICEHLSILLEEEYKDLSDNSMEYQLQRMKLFTTKDMLRAIDIFIFKYLTRSQVCGLV
ncbi:hypothetical protein ABD91_25775 [Lysinibacillus sphaericus]|uniref:hypothetical protein n=1 Tax=Lysinibacillus sphaericus TaxID=1421 RepID=UPI0018CC99E8|nr:hypothetical protein [Lysinibacillus sphaericus]MBG9694148.1 hypothetical protein [Lysinibacillus sphaericus]